MPQFSLSKWRYTPCPFRPRPHGSVLESGGGSFLESAQEPECLSNEEAYTPPIRKWNLSPTVMLLLPRTPDFLEGPDDVLDRTLILKPDFSQCLIFWFAPHSRQVLVEIPGSEGHFLPVRKEAIVALSFVPFEFLWFPFLRRPDHRYWVPVGLVAS